MANFAGLPDPYGLKFHSWASIAVEHLAEYGVGTPPEDENLWSIWAADLINGTIPGSPPPSPYGFSSWQEWASALIGTLS